ncbi:hypothetical protein McanMca71_001024 [Microsporum canis]
MGDIKDQVPDILEDVQQRPNQAEEKGEREEVIDESKYMKGWKLYMLTLGFWIALFLSTLETTIVSTSLVAITDSLRGFDIRNWIVTAYFLTYTGFLIIYAKLSSIFGQKTMMLLALSTFTVFSIGCGVTNDITTLIILRSFQGVGASGIYSMVLVFAPSLVPKREYGKFIGIISSVFVLASVLGPILGGIIATHSTWRWVFLLNAPGGAISIILIAIFLPASKHDIPISLHNRICNKLALNNLKRVDILGAFLLLVASILFVFALQEGGSSFPWRSTAIICAFTTSGIAWVAFILVEIRLENSPSLQEPIFPIRLLKNRVVAGMMITTFLIGFPFVAIVTNIPQRSQAVNGFSAVRAGLTLLPLLLSSPFATTLSGVLTSKFKVPPIYIIFIGAILQVLGVGLTITLPDHGGEISALQYVYETIMGIGFGFTLTTILTLAQLVVEEQEAGLVMGALTQVRVLGGTISVAICSTALSSYLAPRLAVIITPAELKAIADSLSAINNLTSMQKDAVRNEFAHGYNRQMGLLTVFSGLALLATLLLWERKPRVVV